jgi:uncharacterized membrane protein YcaP (DUF421 family)
MAIDWSQLFLPSVAPLEMIVRGSAMYWFLVLLFRGLFRRDVGSIGIADVLFLVIVADASQNAMAGDSRSITDGFILVGTIAFWNFLVNWLGYRFPQFERRLRPSPLLLIHNGKIVRHNMKREFITEADLLGKIREHGYDDVGKVKAAYMESDGQISVIKK